LKTLFLTKRGFLFSSGSAQSLRSCPRLFLKSLFKRTGFFVFMRFVCTDCKSALFGLKIRAIWIANPRYLERISALSGIDACYAYNMCFKKKIRLIASDFVLLFVVFVISTYSGKQKR
jgi:hypothetical protein